MATRLVSRVNKRLDAGITVKDIFDQPVVADLAVTIHLSQPTHVTRTNNDQKGAASVPFHLLALEDPKEFVDREIASRLAHEQGRILNVYPVTHVQKKYLQDPTTCRPRAPFYFFFDAPPDLYVFRLKRCIAALIRHFDIFRTVFLLVEDTFYQVVQCRQLAPKLTYHNKGHGEPFEAAVKVTTVLTVLHYHLRYPFLDMLDFIMILNTYPTFLLDALPRV